MPLDFDLLVINLDSNDYYEWRPIRELSVLRPAASVISCERLHPIP